jgi:hypothetical protein
MRSIILLTYLSVVVAYSFKNWFRALCFSIPMIAILERSDMPRGIFGIAGLNFFNVMLLFILIAFVANKNKFEKYSGLNLPKRLFYLYAIFFLLAFVRLIINYDDLYPFYNDRLIDPPSIVNLFKEELINRIKWVVPALLICIGVTDNEKAKLCMQCVFAAGMLLTLQVISRMMPALIGGDDLADRALRVLDSTIGYHRTDLGGILAGTAWGALALRFTSKSKLVSLIYIGCFGLATLGLMLTGSRAGYGSWAVCGMVLILLRWRKLILLAPIVFFIVLAAIPGVQDRMLEGFTEESRSHYATSGSVNTVDEQGRDLYQITSGRVLLWPAVIEEIKNAPVWGHGMMGFQSLAINIKIVEATGGGSGLSVGHSHNAYLSLALESGIISVVIVMAFYFHILNTARKTFTDQQADKTEIAKAGFIISFVVSQLLAYAGQGTFWPHQVAFFMYCSIGMYVGSSQLFTSNTKKTKELEEKPASISWRDKYS